MQILDGLDGLRQLPQPAVLSIGNFDGIHRGHMRILRDCREMAGQDGQVALVTFEPHPLTVLRPDLAPPRLTPTAMKQDLLAQYGADYLVILAPEPQVLNLTAEEFWAILRDEVRPVGIVEGDEFSFGKGRGGTTQKLRQWAAESGIRLDVVEPVHVVISGMWMVRVSSSIVRWLLSYGRVRDAAVCLGRPYTLEGPVIHGQHRGRGIGMPTANLDCGDQLVPADGVYAARCRLGHHTYPVALSIGTMPTFGENQLQVKAHLIGFDGDLYGQTIRIELLDWTRDQWRFLSVDQLKSRMARDVALAAEQVHSDPSRSFAEITPPVRALAALSKLT